MSLERLILEDGRAILVGANDPALDAVSVFAIFRTKARTRQGVGVDDVPMIPYTAAYAKKVGRFLPRTLSLSRAMLDSLHMQTPSEGVRSITVTPEQATKASVHNTRTPWLGLSPNDQPEAEDIFMGVMDRTLAATKKETVFLKLF